MSESGDHGLRRVGDLVARHGSSLEVEIEVRWCPVRRSVIGICYDLSSLIYWAAWGAVDDTRLWDFM